MKKEIVYTESAPAPIGPYSQAVISGGFIFVSGQIALDPITGELVNKDIKAETQKVMENISAILSSKGLGVVNIVKTTIFLKKIGDFAQVNEVYGSFFTRDFPA